MQGNQCLYLLPTNTRKNYVVSGKCTHILQGVNKMKLLIRINTPSLICQKMMLFPKRSLRGTTTQTKLNILFRQRALAKRSHLGRIKYFPENYDSDNIEFKMTIYPITLPHLIFIKRFLIESIDLAKNPLTHNLFSFSYYAYPLHSRTYFVLFYDTLKIQ